jgi:hypothetical protein
MLTHHLVRPPPIKATTTQVAVIRPIKVRAPPGGKAQIAPHGAVESWATEISRTFPPSPFLAGVRSLFEIGPYACPMTASKDSCRLTEESNRRLAAMAPEAHLNAAALLREVMPRLADERQRALAEAMACRFEGRAAQRSLSSSA